MNRSAVKLVKKRNWELPLALLLILSVLAYSLSEPSPVQSQLVLGICSAAAIFFLLKRVSEANKLNQRLELQNEQLIALATNEAILSGNASEAARELSHAASKVLGADRVGIWTFSEDYEIATAFCLYNSQRKEFSEGYSIERKRFPLVFDCLLQGRIVSYNDCHQFPKLATQLSEAAGVSVRSILNANVQHKNELQAVVCFSNDLKRRDWSADEKNFASSIADLLAICLSSARENFIEDQLQLKSLAIDTALDGIGILNHGGQFRFVNKALIEMFGFESEEELLALSWRELYAEQELKRFDEYILPRFFRQKELSVETIGKRKDGSLFPQELSLKRLEDEGWIVIARDISRRKRVERSAEQVALFATLDPSPVIRFGMDGKILIANPAAIELLGIRGEQDESLASRIPELADLGLNSLIKDGALKTISTEIAGKMYRLVLKGIPYLDAGHLYAFDISDLQEKEVELERSQSLMQDVINSNPNLIFLKDKEGQFKLINKAAADLFGHSVNELIGRRDVEFVENSFEVERMQREDASVLSLRKDISVLEDEYTSPTGETRWLQTMKRPIRVDGEWHILGVATDITEQKELREQLVQSSRLEALGQLAGGIAHDFNNLLTGVFGYTNLLKLLRGQDAQVSEAAEMIEGAAKRASQLTEKLLGFARKGKHRSVVIDIHKALDEVYSLMRRTFERNLTIEIDYGAEETFILGDPTQISQVFLNLVINARDAMSPEKGGTEGGLLSVRTQVLPYSELGPIKSQVQKADQVLEVSIADTGCGMSKSVREKIFEPFFTTKEEGKGTGMGLAMVYGIIQNHGGSIVVESNEGQGSTFRVLLPIFEPDEKSEFAEADEIRSQPERLARGSGNILLVDDHSLVREVGSKMLSTLGYQVVTARDGVEAIRIYERNPFDYDLVILDMVMPRMGARECFRQLKGINPEVRALLSSGYVDNNAIDQILSEGVTGFVQKPYRLRDLSLAVESALAETNQGPKIAV